MANRYPYTDAYLAPQVTREREDRAAALVAELGTLPTDWVERLTVLQAYVITCTECMKSQDDLFGAKLGAYRKQYADSLPAARSAQVRAEEAAGTYPSGGQSPFSIDLYRA